MTDEKKKIAVVGVLFVLVISIGAFQFVGGSEPPPAPAKTDGKKAELAKEADANKTKNPEVAFNLSTRDPFEAPEPPKVVPPAPVQEAPRPRPRRDDPGFTPMVPSGVQQMPAPMQGTLGATTPPKVEEPKFGYTVAGVMLGDVALAVFRDSGGNQRLVREGGSLDGDTKVLSIQKGKVTVSFRGKNLELTNGGSASAK